MPSKKRRANKQATRQTSRRTKRAATAGEPAPALTTRLNDLKEEIEIMVPELTARVAAVEHLLVEKKLCTHDDLLLARQFVDAQEQ